MNQIDLLISEIEASRMVGASTYDDDGNKVPWPEGEYEAELERVGDKTFFRLRALSRDKVAIFESPLTTEQGREEAVAKAFEALGRSFFHAYLKKTEEKFT